MNVIPTTSFTDFSPRKSSDDSKSLTKLESHTPYFALYKMDEVTHSGGKILEC